MRTLLRIGALAIALAGVVDPAIARRAHAPLSVQFRLPPESHPDSARAEVLRGELTAAIGGLATIDGPAAPAAIIALGDADVSDVRGARVFAIDLAEDRPSLAITALRVPRRIASGQSAEMVVSVRAAGLAGRRSTVTLELGGVSIAAVEHMWSRDEENFDARVPFVPPGPGIHRIRAKVTSDDMSKTAVADEAVVLRADPLRILAFEARPSWPLAFVRRTLEADPLFDVASAVRTSRPAATISRGAAASLRSADVDRYDALVIGSLDQLSDADLDVLDRFASKRGGTLVLLPDRQISDKVRTRLDVPRLDESLFEQPMEMKAQAGALKASELLLAHASAGIQSLAAVPHANVERPVVFVLDRGAGRVIVSGALDAWRYRTGSAFDPFWRSLVADAALLAPARLDVAVAPQIARPGDAVKVTVDVRSTESQRIDGEIRVPSVSATLISRDGRGEPIRLWPSTRAGSFEALLDAPAAGSYTVEVSIEGSSTSVPLLIGDDVVHASGRSTGAAAEAARMTGGAVVRDASGLAQALTAIDAGIEERTIRPMRSAWWIVPFALLLCAEWTLRRRSGLK